MAEPPEPEDHANHTLQACVTTADTSREAVPGLNSQPLLLPMQTPRGSHGSQMNGFLLLTGEPCRKCPAPAFGSTWAWPPWTF